VTNEGFVGMLLESSEQYVTQMYTAKSRFCWNVGRKFRTLCDANVFN